MGRFGLVRTGCPSRVLFDDPMYDEIFHLCPAPACHGTPASLAHRQGKDAATSLV